MSSNTIKAIYFTGGGEPVEAEFPLYTNSNKQPLTALTNPAAPLTFIPHDEYDATVKAFKRLSAPFDQTFRQEALNGHMKEQPSTTYISALQASGLSRSVTDLEIVKDHLNGGTKRNEPVYSVDGHPVVKSRITPIVVSFMRGARMDMADRFHQAFTTGTTEQALSAVMRETRVDKETATRRLNSPITRRLREAAISAL